MLTSSGSIKRNLYREKPAGFSCSGVIAHEPQVQLSGNASQEHPAHNKAGQKKRKKEKKSGCDDNRNKE